MTALPRWLMRASGKTAHPLSLIMFDIDYFKQFNDIYGHLAGDDCLRQVAQVLRDVFRRPQDVVARFGSEELVAVLPETDGQAALAQSAPFSSAKQAICNDAMRPKMARQKYKLLLCEP